MCKNKLKKHPGKEGWGMPVCVECGGGGGGGVLVDTWDQQ